MAPLRFSFKTLNCLQKNMGRTKNLVLLLQCKRSLSLKLKLHRNIPLLDETNHQDFQKLKSWGHSLYEILFLINNTEIDTGPGRVC